MKKIIWTSVLIPVVGLAMTAWAQQTGMDRHQRLDSLSKTVEANPNPESAKKLTDEVLGFPHIYELPPAIQEALSTKMATAEADFRQGKTPGITEEEIVQLHNQLADQLKLPEHGKTSVEQLRHLRSKLSTAEPTFMGKDMTLEGRTNPNLSPSQAIHLWTLLINQKALNPEFQDGPSTWRPNQNRLEDVQGMIIRSSNARGSEFRQALNTGVSNLTPDQAMKLWHDSLKALHMEAQ